MTPAAGRGPMSEDATHFRTEPRANDFDLFGGLRRRIVATIAASVAWVSFTLLYLAFWAPRFSLIQSLVVGVVSLLALAGTLFATWISAGFRFLEG